LHMWGNGHEGIQTVEPQLEPKLSGGQMNEGFRAREPSR
jgi:hypothetical protein